MPKDKSEEVHDKHTCETKASRLTMQVYFVLGKTNCYAPSVIRIKKNGRFLCSDSSRIFLLAEEYASVLFGYEAAKS